MWFAGSSPTSGASLKEVSKGPVDADHEEQARAQLQSCFPASVAEFAVAQGHELHAGEKLAVFFDAEQGERVRVAAVHGFGAAEPADVAGDAAIGKDVGFVKSVIAAHEADRRSAADTDAHAPMQLPIQGWAKPQVVEGDIQRPRSGDGAYSAV